MIISGSIIVLHDSLISHFITAFCYLLFLGLIAVTPRHARYFVILDVIAVT